MKTKAAVLVETGQPLEITEIEVPALKPGQVLVEVAYSGICYTQVLECRGHKGKDAFLPHCLGHEGSGTVLEIGAGVTKVKPDDRVILSWIKGSGAEVAGTVYGWGEKKVNAGGVTTLSRLTIVSENRLTVLREEVSFRDAALLGCAVPTGFGSVVNTAQLKSGMSVAIFGAGGVGLCAIAAASITGCFPIVAIDLHEEKLSIAKRMGATHVINAANGKTDEQLQQIAGPGFDATIEATGLPAVMNQALRFARHQGGVAVVVGNARHGELLTVDPKQLNMGKQLRGSWGGDNLPDRDFPRYSELIASKRLDLQPLISRIYSLAEVNEAIDDLENGKVSRPLVDLNVL